MTTSATRTQSRLICLNTLNMKRQMPAIERIVALCCRHAGLVVLVSLLASLAASVYTATHFQLDTNSERLVSAKTHWRRREIHFDKLFPQQNNLILVVIDGATPELAQRGASALTEKLAGLKSLFPEVRRPNGGAFFERNGLLFLPQKEVAQTAQQLIRAQPLLGVLAADPSLRGIMTSLDTLLQGVSRGQTQLGDLARPLATIGRSLSGAANGKRAFLSWQTLVTGARPTGEETRQLIEIQPKLDFTSVEPGLDASNEIRKAARALGLTPEKGVRVRLTGPIPLSDEEFASLQENSGLLAAAMFAAVLAALWFAVRSARIVLSILLTLIVGLALTTGIGLAVVGVFNIISVAFVALFVGLGVDFAIQFSVRYRAERHLSVDLDEALRSTGRMVGVPLALAAAATAAAFLSFLPTNYVGVAELGLVSGIGMIFAFGLSISLLPALLSLLKLMGEPEPIGLGFFAPIDSFLRKNRSTVLRVAAALAVGAIALVPSLRFDFNPLDLRSRKVESVATLFDLMKDPLTSPNTIDVLAPSLNAAKQRAARLSAVPEISQIVTLESFVPADQQGKLALIRDADLLLDPTLNPILTRPPPSDSDVVAAMRSTSAQLRSAAANDRSQAGAAALRLADALGRLVVGSRRNRAIAQEALVPGLETMLNQLRSALTAQPVTLKTLPPDLVREWVAADGTVRLQVFPRGKVLTNDDLKRFSDAVLSVAPDATGTPISIQNYGKTILRAFIQAGLASTAAITAILLLALRRVRDTILTLLPLLLTGLLTLATCVLVGLQLNFANVIALPLLLGVGVAFDIYFIAAWREGTRDLLSTSLTRAVIFSALTTASGFGTLWISSHPGTASMGQLLMISLGWTLATTLFFLPALLDSATDRGSATRHQLVTERVDLPNQARGAG